MKTPPVILPLTPTQGLEGSVRAPSTYFIFPKWTEMGKSSSALPKVEKVLITPRASASFLIQSKVTQPHVPALRQELLWAPKEPRSHRRPGGDWTMRLLKRTEAKPFCSRVSRVGGHLSSTPRPGRGPSMGRGSWRLQ